MRKTGPRRIIVVCPRAEQIRSLRPSPRGGGTAVRRAAKLGKQSSPFLISPDRVPKARQRRISLLTHELQIRYFRGPFDFPDPLSLSRSNALSFETQQLLKRRFAPLARVPFAPCACSPCQLGGLLLCRLEESGAAAAGSVPRCVSLAHTCSFVPLGPFPHTISPFPP